MFPIQAKAMEIKCKGMDIKVTEDQMMNVKECLKPAGITKVMELSPETAGVSLSIQ